MTRPLPKEFSPSSDNFTNVECWNKAYQLCVVYEARQRKADGLPAICARILGYLLLHLPKDAGKDALARRILSGNGASEGSYKTAHAIQDLGMLYLHHLLRYFRRDGLTPSASAMCSQNGTPQEQRCLDWYLNHAPDDIQRAEALALIRDHNRCVISGRIDLRYYNDNEEDHCDEDECDIPPLTLTQPTYIIPEAVTAASEKAKNNFTRITKDMGYPELAEEIFTYSVNGLQNVLTVDRNLRYLFNTACMWFEAVDYPPHEFRVILGPSSGTLRRHGLRNNTTVTFRDAPHLPAPNPDYLELHATCCKVLHLSGAMKYLDDADKMVLNSFGLSPDGSSIHALSHALAKLGT